MSAGYAVGAPVIEDLDLLLDGAGLVRLGGPNGQGKSTLLEVISGYLRPTGGDCLVAGLPAHDPRVRIRRRVCRTHPALHPFLSLNDHLLLAADLAGEDRAVIRRRAEGLGLGPWGTTRTGDLSTGTAKKAWYLMCTAGDVAVMALDEPFNGVDAESVQVMVEELTAWSRERLVLLVCHDVPEGLPIARTCWLGED